MKLLLFLVFLGIAMTPALSAGEASKQSVNASDSNEDETDDDLMDSEAYGSSDDDIPDAYDMVEPSIADTPLSIHLQFGRKWYREAPFDLDMFEFITEWYLFENIPIKLGPTLSYHKIAKPRDGIAAGQILELGLRGSFFWDFGQWSPYLALRYSVLSSGSLDYQHELEGQAQKGTVDLKIRGFDLTVGAQIKLTRQIYLTTETSIVNEEKVKISGKIAKISRDSDTDEIEREVDQISENITTKFGSVSIGLLFEL